MLCERPSRRSDAKELHFRILAQPGCVFLEVPKARVVRMSRVTGF